MVSYKALNTIKESISLNARHAVRQYKFGHTAATIERTIPDARHAARQCLFGQATASFVFASRFISTTCTYNGRKVPTWILSRVQKMKN